jgi:hypothetical protein
MGWVEAGRMEGREDGRKERMEREELKKRERKDKTSTLVKPPAYHVHGKKTFVVIVPNSHFKS